MKTLPTAAALLSCLVVGAGQVETHALRWLHALQHLRGGQGGSTHWPITIMPAMITIYYNITNRLLLIPLDFLLHPEIIDR